jgi:hypothetical protein
MILTVVLKDLSLKFRVLDNPMAQLWLERMGQRYQYSLDDPERFYGFNSLEQDQILALKKINHCIDQIRSRYDHIDRGHVQSVHDQDSLNYWHHVFEIHHGLLEQENKTDPLTPVLCELNVAVHRCESVARGNRPRFVCTWYGLPKTKTLTAEIMKQHGTLNPSFGSICLNYCEIGKTLEDLTQDRDNYISDNAFRPFQHYSADFNVRMHQETSQYISDKIVRMKDYYNLHRDFFFERGYGSFDDPRLLPLRFPVAELVTDLAPADLITAIAQQQCITQVNLQ